ncbi:MAG: O-antigen ligase family protein [Candidatus Brocadiia bacterium]
MKLRLSLRTVNLALVVLLILVMPSTLGFALPLGKTRLPVSIADVVAGLAFVGVVLDLASRRFRGLRLPPLQAFLVVLVTFVVLVRTSHNIHAATRESLRQSEAQEDAQAAQEARTTALAEAKEARVDAVKELLQHIEYFLVVFAVFVNAAETSDLKVYLAAFAVATAGVVGWAAVDYLGFHRSPFRVSAGYENRNLLGTFLALALPLLYGLALYARRWRVRAALLVVVAGGLVVNLAGGALFATLLVLLLLSALRGQRALVPYLVVAGAALLLAPRLLPRPHHTDVLFASVAPYVDDNYLLGGPRDEQLVARARELLDPQDEGEKPRPLDARRLLRLLSERRELTDEEMKLYGKAEARISPAEERNYLLRGPQVAVRYQRWHAAIGCARDQWTRPSTTLLGRGFVAPDLRRYHELLKDFWPRQRLQYDTDEPEVYNVAAPEPFTYNLWLKTLVQSGLVGLAALVWLVATFLFRASRLYRKGHSELALGLSSGAVGSLVGFALAGVFTETLVRGVAIPFVFVLALIAIAERMVWGRDPRTLDQLTRYD